MFKKIASDALGLSDIGSVIKPQDYDKVEADDYIMHEDDEKIYFLIKSKSDEYCFTNKALIHLDGTSAASKKRTLRRFDYRSHRISNISLETAGTIDNDVEIKFVIGSVNYSIDVHKNQLEDVKDLYKALIKIEELTHENDIALGYAKNSLDLTASTMNRLNKTDGEFVEQFKEINQYAFNWLATATKKYSVKDFGAVFERYINN